LNTLAAYISTGRNIATEHDYSGSRDSRRVGKQIAIGMLKEQARCNPTDPFAPSVPTFGGSVRRIGRR
jgi:hypothetical protein